MKPRSANRSLALCAGLACALPIFAQGTRHGGSAPERSAALQSPSRQQESRSRAPQLRTPAQLEQHRRWIDAQRRSIRTGTRQWKLSTSLDLVDDLIPPARRTAARAPSNFRANNVNQPWGALIDAGDYFLDFEDPAYQITTLNPTGTNPFITLQGVVDPSGEVWFIAGSAAVYTGIVDNAAAQTGIRWDPNGSDNDPLTEGVLEGDPDQHGEVGGPDPLGLHGKFVVGAAGSMATQPLTFGSRLEGWLTAKFYAPTATVPVVTIIDMYHDRVDSGLWYSPLSETEGNFFVVSSFWFGYTFSGFSVLADPDNVIRRPFILGPRPGPETGQFFVHPESSPWRIKTDEWFSVGIRQAIDSESIWVRDSQTIGVNGFAQNSIYDGLIGTADPGNTKGAFAGEVFENEWLQIHPGVDDDPGTTIIEGYGTSHNDFFQNYIVLTDSSGSPAGPTFNSIGIDALHFRGGFDPQPTKLPGWTPNDHYIDNFVIMGNRFPTADPIPDFRIPYVDDMERWTVGAVRLEENAWAVPLLQNPSFVSFENNTPLGTQAVEQVAVFRDNVYQLSFGRQLLPTVTATATTPVVVQSSIKMTDSFLGRGFVPQDSSEHDLPMANIILGGRDASFLIDDKIYARQPNPLYNSTISETEQSGANIIDNGIANVPLVNVPLVDATALTALTVPAGAWFDVRVEVLLDATGNGAHPMSVFFDFGTGMVQGVPDGSVRGITTLTSPTPSVNRFEWWTGSEIGGLLSTIFVDDLLLDGPRTDDRFNVETENPASSYADDIAFALPYVDDLSTYELWQPIDNRGFSPFLNTVFSTSSGFTPIDIVDVLAAPVAGVTPVFTYTIDAPEILGTMPGGPYIGGDDVAVVDNIPAFLNTLGPPAQPGSTSPRNPSRLDYRDASRVRLGAIDVLLNNTAPAPWDGTTPVIGRYQFQYDTRWSAPDGQNLVVNDPTASGRGNMIALTTRADADAVTGDLDPGLDLQLPEARALGGSHAIQEFDIYLQDDNPADGPRGRVVWSLQGIGASRGTLAQIALGGPNIYEDSLSFNSLTGVISPGPDGNSDTFQFNDFQSNPAHVFVRVDNPIITTPEKIMWVDTGDVMPLNTWVHCAGKIFRDGSWEITLDDGVTPLTYSGAPFSNTFLTGNDVSGTDFLKIELGNDEGSDGSATLPAIQWYSLGENAAPEGGLDVLSSNAGDASFNDTLKYFYYEINQILAPALSMPTITDVFIGDGSIVGPRATDVDDQIAFWNDQSTAGMGGPLGVPIDARQTPRNTRWEFVDQTTPSTVLARGFWTPLGLPGPAGVNNPAPRLGISSTTPPYNQTVPFEDLLMGTMVSLPQPADFSAPLFAAYIDNVSLDINLSCLGNINIDGVTNGADLGLLLGGWGLPGITDLNGDGTTNGADLGLLLGSWGPCQ